MLRKVIRVPTVVYIYIKKFVMMIELCTLCADEYDWYILVRGIPIMRQFRVVTINGIEAVLVFQTEHEYDGVDP